MSYDYSENILVQESAGHLLEDELGWRVELAYNTEVLGETGTFGRKSYKEILLVKYLKEALLKLNPWLTPALLEDAIKTFESHMSSASLMQINEENYRHIRDGIPVKVKKQNGQIEEKKAIVIDFTNPENNDFLAIREMKIHGDLYRRRTDIVGFVNGIPLLFIELKKNSVDVQNAYTDNYTDYLDTIPHLFYYNAFLMLSNGTEAKVGTLGSKYEFFHEWKRLSEQEEGNVALETMLRGICKKDNFLDLLENFISFDHSDGETVKILARNHQYLGVNEAVKAYEARKLNNGKLGVFWHTQGSGKSYSMVFLSQKIRRKFAGSPTIVILTDRDELNTQISDTFENCGLLGKTKAAKYIATSGDDLITKLQGNPSFIFTLIQKFNKKDVQPIIPDHDIIIMSDEAHRSQYGIFADNMVNLLPTAARIGFTGTPLLLNDNITERTFGGYISIYDFKRAVEDKATVPLYYENRGEKILDLDNPDITDKILDAIEAMEFLIPPKEQDEFYICQQKSIDSGYELIENNFSDEFDYKIKSVFDGENFMINLYRNEFDVDKIPENVFREERFMRYPYRKEDFKVKCLEFTYSISQLFNTSDSEYIERIKQIGSFTFEYIFMKLQNQKKEVFFYKEIGKTRNEWLEEHGGIKIYRDNFWVRPYGENGSDSFDWLGLEARNNANPVAVSSKTEAWTVRNAQGQGTVFISRINNASILDKSSREGIIENESFKLLKDALIRIISAVYFNFL